MSSRVGFYLNEPCLILRGIDLRRLIDKCQLISRHINSEWLCGPFVERGTQRDSQATQLQYWASPRLQRPISIGDHPSSVNIHFLFCLPCTLYICIFMFEFAKPHLPQASPTLFSHSTCDLGILRAWCAALITTAAQLLPFHNHNAQQQNGPSSKKNFARIRLKNITNVLAPGHPLTFSHRRHHH